MKIKLLPFTALTLAVSLCSAVSASPLSSDKYVKIDGSSTVYPITEAVAEEFGIENRSVKVTVGISGTGGGFKRFCAGEIDISDASRPIKATERAKCDKNGVEFIELPVAYDALTVVVNPKNDWVSFMTVSELKKLWEPAAQGKITKWNQIRPNWPDKKITLFGPGVDSGTFDYFTEVIVGKAQASRGDYTSSEDDNVLVQGVANDPYSLGYFGMAYYLENQNKLKAVAIDDEDSSNGTDPKLPTAENVIEGVYTPLSRPLFIYVNKASLSKKHVDEFVSFYLNNASDLASEVGYVSLPEEIKALALKRYQKRILGSVFAHTSQKGATLAKLMKESM